MRAFNIKLNGKRLVTAGLDGDHVLSIIVASVVRQAEVVRLRGGPRRELDLNVGGLISRPGGGEHVHWLRKALKTGDTITLTVLRTDEVDPPRRRKGQQPKGKGVAPASPPRSAKKLRGKPTKGAR